MFKLLIRKQIWGISYFPHLSPVSYDIFLTEISYGFLIKKSWMSKVKPRRAICSPRTHKRIFLTKGRRNLLFQWIWGMLYLKKHSGMETQRDGGTQG